MVPKISLNVEVPSIGQTLNFIVPETMKISNVIELMTSIIRNEFKGLNQGKDQLLLIQVDEQMTLNGSCSCAELGIHNGTNLMLI